MMSRNTAGATTTVPSGSSIGDIARSAAAYRFYGANIIDPRLAGPSTALLRGVAPGEPSNPRRVSEEKEEETIGAALRRSTRKSATQASTSSRSDGAKSERRLNNLPRQGGVDVEYQNPKSSVSEAPTAVKKNQLQGGVSIANPGLDTDASLGKSDTTRPALSSQSLSNFGLQDPLTPNIRSELAIPTFGNKPHLEKKTHSSVNHNNNSTKEGSTPQTANSSPTAPLDGNLLPVKDKQQSQPFDWYAEESKGQGMLDYISGILTGFTKQKDDHDLEYERLKREHDLLRQHCAKLEERLKSVMERERIVSDHLQQEKSHSADLRRDVARFTLNPLESTKDDRYFSSKFMEIFLSVEGWVVQFFLNCPIASELITCLQVPEALNKCMTRILGGEWTNVFREDHLSVIEALVHRLLMDQIWNYKLLGLVGKSIDKLEGWIDDTSTLEEVTQWRLQTIRMVTNNKEFPKHFSERVTQMTTFIDDLLSPLGKAGSKGTLRFKRLRYIIESAAELAIESQQQPSKFRFLLFGRNRACDAEHMRDASGRVGDKSIGVNGAFVGFTISPAVVRLAVVEANSDGGGDKSVGRVVSEEENKPLWKEQSIILVKARIVRREPQPLREEDLL